MTTETSYQAARRHSREAAHKVIVGAMQEFRAYSWDQLKAASGLAENAFASAMATLTRRGLIDKTPEGADFLYSLPC